jgi:insulysin
MEILSTPVLITHPFCRLYTDLLKDSLNEYSYDAEVAGLHYNIENQLEGMLVSDQG